MPAETKHTRLDPDCGQRFLPLRRQLGVSSFGLNQVRLEPGQRGRVHRHKRQEEVYLVLEGKLTLLTDGAEQTFGAGELARVAPDVRRQLVNRTRTRVVLVAIGGAGEHDSGDGEVFTDWDTERSASPHDVPFPDDLDPSELQ